MDLPRFDFFLSKLIFDFLIWLWEQMKLNKMAFEQGWHGCLCYRGQRQWCSTSCFSITPLLWVKPWKVWFYPISTFRVAPWYSWWEITDKPPFKTCGQLLADIWATQSPPSLQSTGASSFPVSPQWFRAYPTLTLLEILGELWSLCCKMQLTTFKSMSSRPGAVCLHQTPGTARKLRIEISHRLKINREKK